MEAVGVYESKIIRYNPNKLISHMVREDKKALQAKVFDSIETAEKKQLIFLKMEIVLLYWNGMKILICSNYRMYRYLHRKKL